MASKHVDQAEESAIKYLNVDEAMEYLRMTDIKRRSFLANYVYGKFPKIKSIPAGKTRIFKTEYLDEFLDARATKTYQEAIGQAN